MLRLHHADGYSNPHVQPTRSRQDAACCVSTRFCIGCLQNWKNWKENVLWVSVPIDRILTNVSPDTANRICILQNLVIEPGLPTPLFEVSSAALIQYA